MRDPVLIFLLFTGCQVFAQHGISPERKQEIIQSKEVKEWQDAAIAFQRLQRNLNTLKKDQRNYTTLVVSCGKTEISTSYEEYILQLFRTMRITEELRDSVTKKEKDLRLKYPEVLRYDLFDELFMEMYAPIRRAREKS